MSPPASPPRTWRSRDIGVGREALAIVRAITGLGTSLLIKTTAEGVETCEQYRRLQEAGCTHFQRYLFGRPARGEQRVEAVALPEARAASAAAAQTPP